jgi:hypothetical protein
MLARTAAARPRTSRPHKCRPRHPRPWPDAGTGPLLTSCQKLCLSFHAWLSSSASLGTRDRDHLGLGNNCCKFRLFHQHGAGNGLLGAVPRWVTYLGRCGEKGWPPVDGWLGQKKYKGSEDKKNMPFLQGPLRAEFSRVDNALYWLSLFGRGVTKGNRGKFYKSSVTRRDARTHTYGCFQFSSTLELATMGRIGRVGHGLGRFGIGAGAWEKGGEACIARSVQGLYLAFGARGRRLGLYSLCPVSVC